MSNIVKISKCKIRKSNYDGKNEEYICKVLGIRRRGGE